MPYPGQPMMMAPPVHQKSAKPIAAGIMYILSMLIGIGLLQGALALLALSQAAGAMTPSPFNPFAIFAGIALVWVIMCVIGIVGSAIAGVLSILRKQYAIALIGGLLAFVGLHFLFGLIGFILLATSKEDFTAAPKAAPAAA